MNILKIIESKIDEDINGNIRKLKAFKFMELESNIIENSRKGYNKKDRLRDIKMSEPVYRKFLKEEGIQSPFKAGKSIETIKVNNFILEYKAGKINDVQAEIVNRFGSVSALNKYNRNKLLAGVDLAPKSQKSKRSIKAGEIAQMSPAQLAAELTKKNLN